MLEKSSRLISRKIYLKRIQVLISSDKKSDFKKLFEINKDSKPYIQSIIIGLSISLLMLYTPITWGMGYLFYVVLVIALTFFINIQIGNYTCFDYGKYAWVLLLLFVFSTPLHVYPMVKEYKTSERYSMIVPLDVETKLFYNDNNRVFILFIGKEKQPLILTTSAELYNKLKSDLLDDKIQVTRKKIKLWYDDTHYDGYYLSEHKFN